MSDQKKPAEKRYPFRADIIIDNSVPCESNDIGEDGLFISTVQHFDEKSIITVTIPFNEDKITLQARVDYCQFGIGIDIKFVNLNNDQKVLIKNIIENLKHSSQ